MIKQLLVCQLLTVLIFGKKMLNLNSPALFDFSICITLKFHHRWRVCWNSVSYPYLGVDNAIKGPM